MPEYNVLIVDDSPFMRKVFSDVIDADAAFNVLATAGNGEEAVALALRLKPDIITMDLEMPQMNGIEALRRIMAVRPTPVIMLSAVTDNGTRDTIKALQYGAFDFIRKPDGAVNLDIRQVGEQLIEKLHIASSAVRTGQFRMLPAVEEKLEPPPPLPAEPSPQAEEATPGSKARPPVPPIVPAPPEPANAPVANAPPAREPAKKAPVDSPPPAGVAHEPNVRALKPTPGKAALDTDKAGKPDPKSTKAPARTPAPKPPAAKPAPLQRPAPPVPKKPAEPDAIFAEAPIRKDAVKRPGSQAFTHLVAIGTSTGGPRALHEVLTGIPAGFPAPILVVQHMPPKFTHSLAQRLDSFCGIRVREATDGEPVETATAYIAPGGQHLTLVKDAQGGYKIRLTEDPPRSGHRPSVDVLFDSLVDHVSLKRHAVLMTGMGSDGAKGMKALQESGVRTTIAEAEETCVVYGMPRSAVELGAASHVLPLQAIAPALVREVQGRKS